MVWLADGRTLLVPEYFVSDQAAALVEGEDGKLLALDISAEGAFVGARPISLARMDEMFGIASGGRFTNGLEGETVLGAADDTAKDGNLLVEMVGGVSALAVGYLMYSEGGDEETASTGRFDSVFGNGLGREGTENEQRKIREALEESVPAGARISSAEGAEWTADGDSSILNFGIDINDDGATEVRAVLLFDASFNLVEARHDDNLNGTSDRTVRYSVNESGERTLAYFDDDGDGKIDRAEAYGTNSNGELETLYDDDFSGVFQIARKETATDYGDGTVTVLVDTNRDDIPDRIETRLVDRGNRLYEVLVDDFSDGSLDGGSDLRKTYHYSDLGLLERVEVEEGVDRTIERAEFYLKGAGVADRSETYAYDALGRLERVEYDDDNNGIGDWSGTYIYAAGVSAAARYAFGLDPQDSAVGLGAMGLAIDANNDGAIDRTEAYTYSNGRLAAVTYDDDASADGTNERRETYEYGDTPQEYPVRKFVDLLADGTIERVEEYSYSGEAGSLPVSIRFDDDYDGTTFSADRVETTRFDGRGAAKRVEYDDDVDGQIERITEFRYGLDQRIAETRLDNNADGEWDAIVFHSWNARGQREGGAYDSDADGTIDRTEFYQYSDKGHLSEVRFDNNADGTVDSSVARTYNARGQIQTILRDYDADGVDDQADRHNYDQAGRLVSIVAQFDVDGDGGTNYERTETLVYQDGVLAERIVEHDTDEDGVVGTTDRSTYGVDSALNGQVIVYDDDDDGTSNREEHSEWANGRLSSTRFVWDDFEDGSPNREGTRTYDQHGRPLASEQLFDQSGDGTWDMMIRVVYTNGLQTEFHIDDTYDGTAANFVAERISVYEYNGDGVLVRVRHDEDADGGATGDFERSEFYREFDGEGRPVIVEYDDNGDGRNNRRVDYSYNAAGQIETAIRYIDSDNAQGADRVETYIYNYDNNTVRVEYDGVERRELRELWPFQEFVQQQQDGTADLIQVIAYADSVFNYDSTGTSGAGTAASTFVLTRVTSIETNRVTGSDDTAVDRIDTYIYDGSGELLRVDAEESADGTVTRRFYHTDDDGVVDIYAYDRDPVDDPTVNVDVRDTLSTTDENQDGTMNDYVGDGTTDYTVGDGTIDRYEFDGTFDAYRSLELDEDGRPVRREHDFDFDGTNFQADIESQYVYDSGVAGWGYMLGRRSVLSDMDIDGDGTMNDYQFPDSYQYLHFFAERSDDAEQNPMLTLTNDLVEDFHHIESISIGGNLHRPGDANPTAALFNLTISVDVLEELSKTDGSVDSRYDVANPYMLSVWGDPSDTLTLSGGFTRDSAWDAATADIAQQGVLVQSQVDALDFASGYTYRESETIPPMLHAYVSDAGVVLVDPAMDVTIVA